MKKYLKIFGLVLCSCIILFVLFQFLRTRWMTHNPFIKIEIYKEYEPERLVSDVISIELNEENVDWTNPYEVRNFVARHLTYDLKGCNESISDIWWYGRAHCGGYHRVFASICNDAFKSNHIDKEVKVCYCHTYIWTPFGWKYFSHHVTCKVGDEIIDVTEYDVLDLVKYVVMNPLFFKK